VSIRGAVATMALEDVLEWAYRRRITGILTAQRADTVLAVGVAAGQAFWASSSRPEEQVGQVLVASGGLDPQALADALSVRDETHVVLGKILMMVGAVQEDTLVMTLATKIRETIAELVTWHDGSFDLEVRPVALSGVDASVGLDVCLGIARRRVARWAQIREAIPGDQCRFFARATAPPAGESVVEADRLWRLATAGERAGRIAAHFGGERFAVLEQLAAWLAAGAIGLDRRQGVRTETPTELAEGAQARLRQGDRAGALEIARRALAVAPDDLQVRLAHAQAERARVAEVARQLLARHRVPRLRRSPAEIAALELTDTERRLVHRIDGRWDLLSLVRSSSVREADALLAIARLAERGVVELS
jgi:hypothetical protein